MANEPIITICGNAVADAELRITPSGVEVASFTVAVTPRTKQGDTWTDGETTFYRCSAWRQMAESISETITKGMRVLVHGRLKTRTYESNGEKRISIEIDVDEVGPSLRYATAKVAKVERGGDSSFRTSGGTKADDPWSSAPPPASKPADEEPPF